MATITSLPKEMVRLGKEWLAIRDPGSEKFAQITQKQPGVFTDSYNNFYDLSKLESLSKEQMNLIQGFKCDAFEKNLATLPVQVVSVTPHLATPTDMNTSLQLVEANREKMLAWSANTKDNTSHFDVKYFVAKCDGRTLSLFPGLMIQQGIDSATGIGVDLMCREWVILSQLPLAGGEKQKTHEAYRRIFETPMLKNHPNLVKMFGVYQCEINGARESHCWIKLCSKGNVYNRWVEGRDTIPLKEWKRLFLQMIDAFKALHDHKIVHRDPKGENIFIVEEGLYQLGDFDLSRCFDDPDKPQLLRLCGTFDMMAPEVVRNAFKGRLSTLYTLKEMIRADIYELGATLYETKFRVPLPWHARQASILELGLKMLNAEIQKECDQLFPEPDKTDLNHLLWRCVRIDPSQRPSLQELKDLLLKDPN